MSPAVKFRVRTTAAARHGRKACRSPWGDGTDLGRSLRLPGASRLRAANRQPVTTTPPHRADADISHLTQCHDYEQVGNGSVSRPPTPRHHADTSSHGSSQGYVGKLPAQASGSPLLRQRPAQRPTHQHRSRAATGPACRLDDCRYHDHNCRQSERKPYQITHRMIRDLPRDALWRNRGSGDARQPSPAGAAALVSAGGGNGPALANRPGTGLPSVLASRSVAGASAVADTPVRTADRSSR